MISDITSPVVQSVQGTDVTIALLLSVLGFGIGLWFTRAFWMDAATGETTTLLKRVQVGVLFILCGSVPGTVQAVAISKVGGVLSMAAFAGLFGLGLIVGYFLPQRFVATEVFANALSIRIRTGAGRPTPVEVFAFTNKFGSSKACYLLHLNEADLDRLFTIGIEQMTKIKRTLNLLESSVLLDILCGVPVTQAARDYGQSTRGVITILAKAFL